MLDTRLKNKMLKLDIDTGQRETVVIGLTVDGQRYEKKSQAILRSSETLLPLIDKLLKERGKSIKDLTEIQVAVGPGSYTGLRVGIAVANILGFLLSIPVNGKTGEEVEVKY
jgi:tRNA threonylcarbamoyladenosine biosynthesis protein TsaB